MVDYLELYKSRERPLVVAVDLFFDITPLFQDLASIGSIPRRVSGHIERMAQVLVIIHIKCTDHEAQQKVCQSQPHFLNSQYSQSKGI